MKTTSVEKNINIVHHNIRKQGGFMTNYQIITDCTCDLSKSIYEKYPLLILPMEVNLDSEVFMHTKDFQNMDAITFYNKLKNGGVSTTSQINPETFRIEFEKVLNEGKDILYIGFSSGLSGSLQSSIVAKSLLEDKYPDRKIIIVDSLAASAGQGLLVYYALLNQEQGLNIEENEKWLNDHVLNLSLWFTVDDLQFLKRGGRVSGAVAFVGTALKIKPVLHVDNEGHLVNVSKEHGRKASLHALANRLHETIIEPEKQIIFISHADALEDAEFLATKIRSTTPIKDIIFSDIGPVIGSHSGPGTIALFFFATER